MKGLTVAEMLVAILIFSIIMVTIGMAMVAGKNALFTGDVSTQLRQNVLLSIIALSRELRETSPAKTNLGADSTSNSITFQIPFDNNADGVVVDTIGNIEWSGNITYSLNGSNQLIRTQAGATSIIAPNIASIQFERPLGEDKIIQIDITAQKTNSAGTWQDSEGTKIKMRN